MKMNKNIRLIYLSVAAGLCFSLPLSAQHAYTLDECIREALSNNVRIKNAENDLRAARQDRQSAFANYFPSVSATGGGFLADQGLLQMEMAPGQGISMMKNGVVGGVTASLPLFTGGQIANGNKLAEVNVEVKRLQRGLSDKEVRLTAEQYFWQIVTLKEKLKTITTVEKQLGQLNADVEAAVHAGLTTRNDLLQVRLRQNETRSGRIEVENALSLSRSMLAQYIGHPSDSIDVQMDISWSLPQRPDSLYRNPDASLLLTEEYHLLLQNLKASRLQHKLTVGKHLPTVAIGGGYVYENLMDKDQSFWIGFATVSVPLTGWWSGTHEIKRDKLRVQNAEIQLEDQSQLLVIRMQNAWNELNDAYKQMEIALQSIEQADENLRLNTDYYSAGTCTMSELLDAQTLYQQSRDKYVESCMQYEVKKRTYLQATGR